MIHGKFCGAMHEWLYKSPQEVFRCYSIGKGIFRGYLTPANVPAILPIPPFSGRAVGNVGGIDQVYVERVTQSSNDSISCSLSPNVAFPQGAFGTSTV